MVWIHRVLIKDEPSSHVPTSIPASYKSVIVRYGTVKICTIQSDVQLVTIYQNQYEARLFTVHSIAHSLPHFPHREAVLYKCILQTPVADIPGLRRQERWQGEGVRLWAVFHDDCRQTKLSALPFRLLQRALLKDAENPATTAPLAICV